MNKLFTKIATAFVGIAMAIGVGVAVGAGIREVRPVYADSPYTIGWGTASGGSSTNFTTTSGSVTGILSFSSDKNSSSNNPAYNSSSSELRLYYNSGGDGGSITITPVSGITFTGFVMTTSTSPSVKYTVDNGTATAVSVSNNTYTVTGIEASSSLKIQNVNTSNTQLRIKTIALTYTSGSSKTETTTTVTASPASIAVGETSTLSSTITVTSSGEDVDGAKATYSSSNTSVATVSGNVVTAVSAGTTTITASYAGNSTYAASSGQITITVTTAPVYDPTGISFEKITTADGLTSGKHYLIGNSDGSVVMSSTQNSNNRGQTSATVTSGKIAYVTGMEVLTLGKTGDYWTLFANMSSTQGYLYSASSSSNYLRTQTTNNANSEWTITFSNGVPTLVSHGTNTRNTMQYNSGSSCFASYGSASQGAVTLWKEVSTAQSVAISESSVSRMKGDTSNGDITITASNFTPTGISATYSVSNVASIEAGTISNGVIPLNISFLKVDTTVATITVNGGNGTGTYTVTLTVTVTQKPKTLTLNNASISEGAIELEATHGSGGTKQISFTATDSDDQPLSISYTGVTATSSDESVVTLSGSINMVLNPQSSGTATVTCKITSTLDWDNPVTATLTVHVNDDYNTEVKSIVFINDENVEQGSTLGLDDHIETRTANTHFSHEANIKDDELLFSYTNDSSVAVTCDNFVFDVVDDTLNVGEFENRTIYVFTTFDSSYNGSFTVNIEVADRPVSGLIVDGDEAANMDDFEISLQRFSTYDLKQHVTVNPASATDSHEITYTLEDGGDYVTLNNGVITAGQKIGETVAAVTATPVALPSFSVTFWISITREVMTLTADVPVEAYVKVTKAADLTSGDYLIVCESEGVVFDGSLSTLDAVSNTISPTISSGTIAANATTNASVFTYDASANTLKSKSGYYIGNTSDSNALSSSTSTAYTNTLSIDNDGNADIKSSGGAYLRYNKASNQTRFRYYKSSSYTGQEAIQLYKLSNSSTKETSVTVSDELFNIVNAAMTASNGVYGLNLCDSSGTTFNTSAWNTLGSSFTSTIKEDNKLAYARANQSGNEVEQFLYVYDYVIGKKEAGFAAYSGANDFLGRVASGKINTSSARISLIGNITNDINATAIIIVVSLTSLTAIGGYFFLRKKKED